MTRNSVTISSPQITRAHMSGTCSTSSGPTLLGDRQQTIPFEYAIYALGAILPDPINIWKPLGNPLFQEPETGERDLVRPFP